MADPPPLNWKQTGAVAAITVAVVAVLGLVAYATGVLALGELESSADDRAGEPEDAPADPAAGIWTQVYEGKDMFMDDFWAGDDFCSEVEYDLDTLVADGVIASDVDFDDFDLADDDVDLVWDACTDWEQHLASLSTTEVSAGSHSPSGSTLEARSCAGDAEAAFAWRFDTFDPATGSLEEGSELCVVTSEGNVMLARAVRVAVDQDYGLGIVFEASLWELMPG
ncbi:hypothetical protein GCM10009853_100570 [Glycomyces scopariae]